MNPGAFLTNDPFGDSSDARPVIGGILGGGEPSRYSQSPFLWNGLFRRLGIPGRFVAFDLPRKDLVPGFISAALRLPGLLDLTVTNPYKAAAYKALQGMDFPVELSRGVMDLGRLNHILRHSDEEGFLALNTDGLGMVQALEKKISLRGVRVLLVGAGDAAASIGYELVRLGTRLHIADIIPPEARRLAAQLEPFKLPGGELASGGWETIRALAPAQELIVSAISAATPLTTREIASLGAGTVFADVRYGEMAEFAGEVRRAGRSCIDGREMLYGQFRIAAEALVDGFRVSPGQLAGVLEEIQREFIPS